MHSTVDSPNLNKKASVIRINHPAFKAYSFVENVDYIATAMQIRPGLLSSHQNLILSKCCHAVLQTWMLYGDTCSTSLDWRDSTKQAYDKLTTQNAGQSITDSAMYDRCRSTSRTHYRLSKLRITKLAGKTENDAFLNLINNLKRSSILGSR